MFLRSLGGAMAAGQCVVDDGTKREAAVCLSLTGKDEYDCRVAIQYLARFCQRTANPERTGVHSMMALNEWKDQLATLPESTRLELVVFLMQTLEPSDPDAEEAWQVEVARRAEEVRQGQARGRPVAEVFRSMRERHPA